MPASASDTVEHLKRQERRALLLAGSGLALVGLASCGTPQPPRSAAPAPAPAPRPMPMPPSQPLAGSYARRPEVMAQVPDIARRLGMPQAQVERAIGNADFLPNVPRLVLPAGTGARRNWRVYRSRFIDPVRIRAGVQFWQENASTLQRAERQFGVPAKYLVGIIGVETIFGRNAGNIRVIDALCTLAFDFPPEHPRARERNQFFRDELEQYLQLTWKNRDDPLALRGSYAGAMGLPQFMPSSWLKYAVDYDGDGHIDLFDSPADAIGSVANYFRQFGWVPGMEPEFPVRFDATRVQMDQLLAPDIVPTFSLAEFRALGAEPEGIAPDFAGKLALIELENGSAAPSYRAGTQNFYVITRYNHSAYYAQSVIDLGTAIERAVGAV